MRRAVGKLAHPKAWAKALLAAATSKPADTGATNNLAMICVLSIWRLSVLEVVRRRRDADVTAMA